MIRPADRLDEKCRRFVIVTIPLTIENTHARPGLPDDPP